MKSKGQSLFEVVIALAISAIIISALVSLVSSSIRNANYAKNNTLAARHAQDATEWLRKERDDDIDNFMTRVLSPTWCLSSLSWSQSAPCGDSEVIPDTIFRREVAFTVGLSSGKTVVDADITVFWEDAQGAHEVKSATSFTDWRQR